MTGQRWCLAGALALAAVAMGVALPVSAESCIFENFTDLGCEPDDYECLEAEGDYWCTDGGGASGGGGNGALTSQQSRNLAAGKSKAAEAFDDPPNANVNCPAAFDVIRALPGGSGMDNRDPRQLIYTVAYKNGIGNSNHCPSSTQIASAEVGGGGTTIYLCRGFNVSRSDVDNATTVLHEIAHLKGWHHTTDAQSLQGTIAIENRCFPE